MKLLAGAVLALLALAPAAHAESWRMHLADPLHSNAVPGSPLRPPLKLRWRVDSGRLAWMALIDGGRVTTLEQVPGQATRVVARSAADGRELWHHEYPFTSGDQLNAATDGGRVFVGRYLSDLDIIRVHAYDAASGAPAWTREVASPQGLAGNLTVHDGIVYVASDTYGSTLHALRQSDGSAVWSAGAPSGSSSPAVDGSRVYFSGGGGQTVAFDRATGSRVWHHDTGISGGGGEDPKLFGGRLYADSGLVLDPASGTKVGSWRGQGVAAFAGEFGFESSTDGTRAFGPGYETTRWSARYFAHLMAGDHVYGGGGNAIFAARTSDGVADWCHELLGPQISGWERSAAPAAAGDGILVATAGTVVAAFENGGSGSVGCAPGPSGSSTGSGTAAGSPSQQPGAGAAPGVTLAAGKRVMYLGQRTNVTGRVAGVPLTPQSRVVVEIDEFPYSDRSWKPAASAAPLPDGTFAFKYAPKRNARLRARVDGLVSPVVEVLADFPARLRVIDRGGAHPRVRYTVYAFRKARIRRQVVHAYLARGTTGVWRRVDSRRFTRLRPASVSVDMRFPAGRLGRRDHWLLCTREPVPDGFGEVFEVDRHCGARTLPRSMWPPA